LIIFNIELWPGVVLALPGGLVLGCPGAVLVTLPLYLLSLALAWPGAVSMLPGVALVAWR